MKASLICPALLKPNVTSSLWSGPPVCPPQVIFIASLVAGQQDVVSFPLPIFILDLS